MQWKRGAGTQPLAALWRPRVSTQGLGLGRALSLTGRGWQRRMAWLRRGVPSVPAVLAGAEPGALGSRLFPVAMPSLRQPFLYVTWLAPRPRQLSFLP